MWPSKRATPMLGRSADGRHGYTLAASGIDFASICPYACVIMRAVKPVPLGNYLDRRDGFEDSSLGRASAAAAGFSIERRDSLNRNSRFRPRRGALRLVRFLNLLFAAYAAFFPLNRWTRINAAQRRPQAF
jgi:hypothetical protein